MSLYDDCHWPELPVQTDSALRDAVRFIMDRFSVHGVIAAGTHISGNPHANSDLDICVIHASPQRQRVQKRFHDIPVEIFVNPPSAIRRYFEAEVRRPCTAHMFVTGCVILDADPVVQTLKKEAADWLARPLELSQSELDSLRYIAADAFENATDIREHDPANAICLLNTAVTNMLDYAFLAKGNKLPRAKALMEALSELDPALSGLARRYYLAHNPHDHFALAEEIARRTIGVTGFFEWESPLGTVQD